jgi:hypothetical protein
MTYDNLFGAELVAKSLFNLVRHGLWLAQMRTKGKGGFCDGRHGSNPLNLADQLGQMPPRHNVPVSENQAVAGMQACSDRPAYQYSAPARL